jgi:hypothetical protein
MAAKSDGSKIVFELRTDALIEYCHDEIVALANKMAEFSKKKK